jgi:hypothetical protein
MLFIFIKARARKTGMTTILIMIATTMGKRVKAIKTKNPPIPIQAAWVNVRGPIALVSVSINCGT